MAKCASKGENDGAEGVVADTGDLTLEGIGDAMTDGTALAVPIAESEVVDLAKPPRSEDTDALRGCGAT